MASDPVLDERWLSLQALWRVASPVGSLPRSLCVNFCQLCRSFGYSGPGDTAEEGEEVVNRIQGSSLAGLQAMPLAPLRLGIPTMGTIVRGLALALALIWPVIGNAVAIIDGPSSLVTGWSNSQGSFAVDLSGPSTADLAGAGVASYSTAASVFSLSASSISYARPVGVASTGLVPADVQIVAAIQGNGTASGNLLTGTLTIRAGPNGFPGTGDGPGVGVAVGAKETSFEGGLSRPAIL